MARIINEWLIDGTDSRCVARLVRQSIGVPERHRIILASGQNQAPALIFEKRTESATLISIPAQS